MYDLIVVKSCTHDLINGSHLECCADIGMQVLDENSQVFYNCIKSLHSDTKEKSIDA